MGRISLDPPSYGGWSFHLELFLNHDLGCVSFCSFKKECDSTGWLNFLHYGNNYVYKEYK